MIGEEAFKGFCSHAANGLAIRALFITPDKAAREAQQLNMFNMADARGLNAMYASAARCLTIRESIAMLRVAHKYLYQELRGHTWDFIHGLEYLDDYSVAEALSAMVRTNHDV